MKQIDKYYETARAFYNYVNETILSEDSADTLLIGLMEIYAGALDLPDNVAETYDAMYAIPDHQVRLEESFADTGLHDDLDAVMFGLKAGMNEYEDQYPGNAAFIWKDGISHIWGSNIVNAIAILHAAKQERYQAVLEKGREQKGSLKESHCIFPCQDIEKTAEYYHEKLGFRRVDYLHVREPHICLYRDGVEIILTSSGGRETIPHHLLYGYGYDAYIITGVQQLLQDEFISKGVRIIHPLETTDYSNNEFVIEDIDGRWIAFGRKNQNS